MSLEVFSNLNDSVVGQGQEKATTKLSSSTRHPWKLASSIQHHRDLGALQRGDVQTPVMG